eukprot:9713761-Alexandrium_andersonii.AAC.1
MPWAPSHRAWWTAQSAIRCTRFHPHRSEEARVGQEETSIWGMVNGLSSSREARRPLQSASTSMSVEPCSLSLSFCPTSARSVPEGHAPAVPPRSEGPASAHPPSKSRTTKSGNGRRALPAPSYSEVPAPQSPPGGSGPRSSMTTSPPAPWGSRCTRGRKFPGSPRVAASPKARGTVAEESLILSRPAPAGAGSDPEPASPASGIPA